MEALEMMVVGKLLRDLRARLSPVAPSPAASTVVPLLIFPPIVSRIIQLGASAELVRLAALISVVPANGTSRGKSMCSSVVASRS
jgi:hypothetical protein